MIYSMTGFGSARATSSLGEVQIELRSLNSKFFELGLKMPFQDATLESDIRNIIQREMQRGKVSVQITLEGLSTDVPTRIDRALFMSVYAELTELRKEVGIKSKPSFSDVLSLPGVVGGAGSVDAQAWREPMLEALGQACQELNENRKAEGHVLEQDMHKRCNLIEQYLKAVLPFEQARMEHIRTRMQQHLREYLGKEEINQDRFEQELIFYLEKLDITEEKIRLQAHLDYFRKTMETEEMPGKKLGFITQEIGREINTLGSKANDASIQKLVVGMKDELEKIKEQTANIV